MVVCTYRRAEKLTACLDALARQTIRDRAEVIVVDDGPDDATAAVASRYDVRLVRHPQNLGLAAARNTGIDAATAPVVAFTDDDCVPADDWLEALVGPYGDFDVVAVGGGVEALPTETMVQRYLAETNRLAPLEIELSVSSSLAYRAKLYLRRNRRGSGTLPGTRAVYSLVGANMSFRRDALVEIGMFDDRISFGGEDEDICRRLRAPFADDRFVFTSRAVIAHDFDGDLRDTLRRSYQYGAGSARGYLKNDDQGPTVFPIPALVAGFALLGAAAALGARGRAHGSVPRVLTLAGRSDSGAAGRSCSPSPPCSCSRRPPTTSGSRRAGSGCGASTAGDGHRSGAQS